MSHRTPAPVSLPGFQEMFSEYAVPSGSGRPMRSPVDNMPGQHVDSINSARQTRAPRSPLLCDRRTVRGDAEHSESRISEPADRFDTRPIATRRLPNSFPPAACNPLSGGSTNNHPSANERTVAHRSLSAVANCSFDVLRPHPFTSDLEHIASISDVSSLSRGHQPCPAAYSARTAPHTNLACNITSGVSATARRSPSNGMMALQGTQPANRPVDTRPNHSYHANPHGVVISLPPDSSDDKKHECQECGKRFNRPSSLRIHVNTHTGVKPFSCDFPGCTRRFNVNSNMRRHYRNHFTGRQRTAFISSHEPMGQGASSLQARAQHRSLSPDISSPSSHSSDPGDSRSPTPDFN